MDLRIALFTGNYNHIRDGVSLTLNRLVHFLEQAGAEVLVFGPTIRKPALDHHGRLVKVPSIAIPGRSEYRMSLSFPKRVQIELEHFDPDIVHIATPDLLGFKALKWAKRKNKVIVSSYHTHFVSYLKYYRLQWLESAVWKYLHWFYEQCSQVYVPTPSLISDLKENGFHGDLRVWARGVNSERFSPSRKNPLWREKYGFEPDDIIITFVSRLVWEKNLEIFAETVKSVMAKNPHLKPLVVGDGPAGKGLQNILPEAVYTGFLSGDELGDSYANSDIFFFPSDTEAFGNVTLEAMASGLPCIVADAVGSKSLVDHGRNGYLIPVSRTDEFRNAVAELAGSKELRNKMGETSYQNSMNYSWNRINSKLLSYYKEALNDKTGNS